VLDHAVQAVLAAYPTIHAACRRRHVRDPLSGRRLSAHQAGLLDHLDPVTPIAVGDLAQRLRVTPATISLQLARLVRLRLVARARDEADARRVQLRLTEAGTRMRGNRSLLDPDRVRAALTQLPVLERDAVVIGVRLLARAASALPDEGTTRPDTARRPRRPPAR
jgi:MarR family transcriptional regulator, organic hydroperoxide resistance regulator